MRSFTGSMDCRMGESCERSSPGGVQSGMWAPIGMYTKPRRLGAGVAASAVMAGVVFALVKLLAPWFAPASGLVAQAAALITLVGVGLVVYLAAAELFRATKIHNIIKEIGA